MSPEYITEFQQQTINVEKTTVYFLSNIFKLL